MSPSAIVVLCKILKSINFSAKKSIIKHFFTKNFVSILEKNPFVVYVLLVFLDSVNDKTVFTITVGKCLKKSIENTSLIKNKPVQHLLLLLSNKDVSNIGVIDKRLALNSVLQEFLGLKEICDSNIFKENLKFLLNSIFSNIEMFPKTFEILEFCSNDSYLSSLIGNILENLFQSYFKRRKNEWIL